MEKRAKQRSYRIVKLPVHNNQAAYPHPMHVSTHSARMEIFLREGLNCLQGRKHCNVWPGISHNIRIKIDHQPHIWG